MKAELEWAREPEPAATHGTTQAKPGRTWWTAAAAIVVLAALGGWAIAYFRQSAAADRVVRFQIDPPEGGQFLFSPPLGGMALSPDGKTVAYVATVNGKSELWVHPLDGTTARPLAGTENASYPFWSPDSKSVAFFDLANLKGPRWVAYESDESSQYEVYIAAFPDPRNKKRISTGGGRYRQWGASGRELF